MRVMGVKKGKSVMEVPRRGSGVARGGAVLCGRGGEGEGTSPQAPGREELEAEPPGTDQWGECPYLHSGAGKFLRAQISVPTSTPHPLSLPPPSRGIKGAR